MAGEGAALLVGVAVGVRKVPLEEARVVRRPTGRRRKRRRAAVLGGAELDARTHIASVHLQLRQLIT